MGFNSGFKGLNRKNCRDTKAPRREFHIQEEIKKVLDKLNCFNSARQTPCVKCDGLNMYSVLYCGGTGVSGWGLTEGTRVTNVLE